MNNLVARVNEINNETTGDLVIEESPDATNATQIVEMRSDSEPQLYNHLALKTDPPGDLFQQFETPLPVGKTNKCFLCHF